MKKLVRPDEMTIKFCRLATIILTLLVSRGVYLDVYGDGHPDDFWLVVIVWVGFAFGWIKGVYDTRVFDQVEAHTALRVQEAQQRAMVRPRGDSHDDSTRATETQG